MIRRALTGLLLAAPALALAGGPAMEGAAEKQPLTSTPSACSWSSWP